MPASETSVLIVDDEVHNCELLCETLSEIGYSCYRAYSATQALDQLDRRPFRLAMIDIVMPGISGMDLIRIIRRSYEKTAILVVSAIVDKDAAAEAIRLGARDFIQKPFEIDLIRKRVAGICPIN